MTAAAVFETAFEMLEIAPDCAAIGALADTPVSLKSSVSEPSLVLVAWTVTPCTSLELRTVAVQHSVTPETGSV